MPIYAYRCAACGHAKDVLQKISDAPLTDCPACGKAEFAKQLTAAGFALKGTGWYVTDFKGGTTGASGGSGSSGDSGSAVTSASSSADTSGGSNSSGASSASSTSSTPASDKPAAASCGGGCACH